MQTHFFNSKTWQYLTLKELELQAKKDNLSELIESLLETKTKKKG